jgi:inner membrane transporter RhtA
MIGSVAGARTLPLPLTGQASGIALAIASMTTIQLGAALSQPLFDRIGPAGLVALRLVLAALILWPLARPRLRGARARTCARPSRSARAPGC